MSIPRGERDAYRNPQDFPNHSTREHADQGPNTIPTRQSSKPNGGNKRTTNLSTLQLGDFPHDLDQLAHLQMRVGLQEQRHVAIGAARDDCRLAAESADRAQESDRLCRGSRTAGRWVEGVEMGWEDAGGLEGHCLSTLKWN